MNNTIKKTVVIRRAIPTNCSVVLMIGDINGRNSFGLKVEDARAEIEKTVSDTCIGQAVLFEGDVYMWMPEPDDTAFVHELYHAVSMVCHASKIRSEEFRAYLYTYLFYELYHHAEGGAK